MESEKEIDTRIINYYKSRVRQNPQSYMYFALADSYKKQGMPEKAIEVCQEGLRSHPNYTTGRTLLGQLFLVCGRYDEAERELKEVCEKVPHNVTARKQLIEVYLKKEEKRRALKVVNELLRLYPRMENYRILQSRILEELGEEPPLREEERAPEEKAKSLYGEETGEVGDSCPLPPGGPQEFLFDDKEAFEEIENLFQQEEKGGGGAPVIELRPGERAAKKRDEGRRQ